MNQRITPDPQSFEQFLAAASLLQHIHKEALHHRAGEGRQPLLELIDIQRAIDTGQQDLRVLVQRIVALAQRVVGASGAGVWFFTRQEFAYFAGVGTISNDERLRLQILSKLAAYQLGHSSLPTRTQAERRVRDAGYYPASFKSLLVAPIYHGSRVVGVLAGFSPQFNAFTERDTENVRFLAGLLAQALDKAVEAGLRENVELEWAATLQLIEKMTPCAQEPSSNQQQIPRRSQHVFPRAPIAQPEPPPAALSSKLPTSCEMQANVPGLERLAGISKKQNGAAEATQPLASLYVNWLAVSVAWFHRHMRQAQSLGLHLWARSGRLLRALSGYQPKLRAIRIGNRGRAITRSKWMTNLTLPPMLSGLWSSMKNARTEWLCYYRQDKPSALYVASAWAVVLITLVLFFALEIKTHNPSQLQAKDSISTSEASAIPAGSGNARVSSDSTPPPGKLSSKPLPRESEHRLAPRPLQLSHLQVTDKETETELRDMTRHEISKLEQDAKYGDDIAAFDLGMAYEIGYEVPQNCAQAANWVAQSAKQGNPAAEYNLGLRYRDGDGVATNAEEAETWLRKAAAQKYSRARVALQALISH
jgi:hypothetical protein